MYCLAHRANLLLWLHRYCNAFHPDPHSDAHQGRVGN
jgi:hypothetical protein